MITFLLRWVISALLLIFVSTIVPGIRFSSFLAALLSVVVISFINSFLKPILLLLTLPLSIITLGLFTFILNAALFQFASMFVKGFEVNSFGAALLGSLLYTIISTLVNRIIRV